MNGEGSPQEISDYDPFIVQRASNSDYPEMASCRSMKQPEKGISLFERREKDGAFCFKLLNEELEIVGYVWASFGENFMEDIDSYHMTLQAHEGYFFDSYINPEARGKRLYTYLMTEVARLCREQGIDTWYATIDADNIASRRAHKRLGSIALEDISFLSILGLTFQRVKGNGISSKRVERYATLEKNGHTESGYCESLVLPPSGESPLILNIIDLSDEGNWENTQKMIRGLEESEHNNVSPLSYFEMLYSWYKNDIKGRFPLYLIALAPASNPSAIKAYSLFRTYKDHKRFLKPCTLAAFDDQYFMDAPFFVRSSEISQEAIMEVFSRADTQKSIRKLTRADVIIWKRISEHESEATTHRASLQWVTKKTVVYPILNIPADSDYLDTTPSILHVKRDIKKQTKRIVNKFGEAPTIEICRLGELPDEEYQRVLNRFFAVRKKTWQFEWESKNEVVDVGLYEEKLKAYGDVWRRKHASRIYFLKIKDEDVAFLYSLQTEDSCWCLLIGYDNSYKSYSPGKQIFLGLLEDSFARGITNYHLGGNVVGWKSDWLSETQYLYNIEFWVSKSKVRISNLLKRLVSCVKRKK